MPQKGHALLFASSSDRWLHCPPSARLSETYEDKGSDYTAEGTEYTSFIMELLEDAKQSCSAPVVLIEQRVDFSRWVEQGFGTSDAILISDGTMHVIDCKHGLGILVSAEDNPQMKCYTSLSRLPERIPTASAMKRTRKPILLLESRSVSIKSKLPVNLQNRIPVRRIPLDS